MSATMDSVAAEEYTLVLTAAQVQRLREWLLQEDGIERFAYVYCTPEDGRLLAREIDPIPAEDCEVQEATAVRPSLSVERDRIGGAMEDGLVPVMLHSHPFSDHPSFSSLDDDIMESYREWLSPLYPDTPLCFGVLGHRGMDTAVYADPERGDRSALPVDVVGDWALEPALEAPAASSAASVDGERYDRSIRALTEAGQRRLAGQTVAVVGLGGLGSVVVTQLARLGVEEFVFADPDRVERSNLPRIYGATEADVGRPKVEVVGEHVVRANPEATVEAYEAKVQDVPEEALAECDVLIGAVDRLTARLYCNEIAVRHLRYYVDAGVAVKTDDEAITEERGLVQLVAPGVTGCLDCLGRNDPERLRLESMDDEEIEADIARGYLDEDVRSPEPAITPLNAFAANAAVRMVTKLVTGYEAPPDYLRLDGVTDDLVAVGTHPSEDCLSCGLDGCLGEGAQRVDQDVLEAAASLDVDVDELRATDESASPIRISADDATGQDSERPGDAAASTDDDAGSPAEPAAGADGGWQRMEPATASWGSDDRGRGGEASVDATPERGTRPDRDSPTVIGRVVGLLRTYGWPLALGAFGALAIRRYLRR